MDLPRNGREYAHLTIDGLPDAAAPEVQVGEGAWTPLEADGNGWRFLVYGPDAGEGEGILVAATSTVRIRLVDTPETIIRKAGGGIRLANI